MVRSICQKLLSLIVVIVCLFSFFSAPAFAVDQCEDTKVTGMDAARAGKHIRIAGNPIESYVIVYGTERDAAEELAHYLGKATGSVLPLIPDTQSAEYEICIGRTDRPGSQFGSDRPERDGFVIKVSDGNLYILGDSELGTLNGVYEFLEQYVGWRFIHRDTDYLKRGDVTLDEGLYFRYEPPFEYRSIDWLCTDDDAWRKKNGINHLDFPWIGWAHTLGELSELHNDSTGQPCLSDESILEMVKKNVRRLLDENPDCRIISVSQNDYPYSCDCPSCRAIDAEEGSPAGTLLRFVNAVADDIRNDYPGVSVETLAYQYTRTPPKITRPRDNVIIRVCASDCCYSHSLSDPECVANAALQRDLAGWSKICERVYIWDYTTNFGHYIAPFPNFRVLRDNMRFFADHHAIGMFPEGNCESRSSNGEFAELRAYLLGRLMWDPYMTEEEYDGYINDFLEGYYGTAAPFIRKFIDFTLGASEGKCYDVWQAPFDIIPQEVYEARFDEIECWWDNAEAVAAEYLDRVQKSRLQWTYVKLMMFPDEREERLFSQTIEKEGILREISW